MGEDVVLPRSHNMQREVKRKKSLRKTRRVERELAITMALRVTGCVRHKCAVSLRLNPYTRPAFRVR